MNLDNLRKDIDVIDDQIIELLNKRMNCIENIANYKKENNIPIYCQNREEAIIKKVFMLSPKYNKYIKCIFENIIKVSKNFQNDTISK